MAGPAFDSIENRKLEKGQLPYVIVSGTTSATANTAALVNHGLTDNVGNPIVPSLVIPQKTQNTTGDLFVNTAGNTTTQIDVRADTSVAGGITFQAILFP
jgi:hypothetical protein